MIFLFDNEKGQSCFKDCPSWEDAESLAETLDWTLVGEFSNWVDEETGNKVYLM